MEVVFKSIIISEIFLRIYWFLLTFFSYFVLRIWHWLEFEFVLISLRSIIVKAKASTGDMALRIRSTVVVHHILITSLHILWRTIGVAHFILVEIPIGIIWSWLIKLSGLLSHDWAKRVKTSKRVSVGHRVIGVHGHSHASHLGHVAHRIQVAHTADAAHAVGVVAVLGPVILAWHVHTS